MQKRIISIIIIILGCLIITSCGKSEDKPNIVGGWEIYTKNKTIDIPISAKNAFEKAYKNYDEIELEPIALLGSQVVSGKNYAILALGEMTADKTYYTIDVLTIYVDLNNNSLLSQLSYLNLSDFSN